MSTDPNSEHIALAEHALSAPASYLLEPLDVNQLASFLSSHDELWFPTYPGDIGTGPLHGFYVLPGFYEALRRFADAATPPPSNSVTLSLTDADLDAIRVVVAEEIARSVAALHGDLDDPTDGPLDQAALRRHGVAVDLVRQDIQDHCMACGHKGEVAS